MVATAKVFNNSIAKKTGVSKGMAKKMAFI